eukprot:scaffold108453_cov69-Phaeocystis_antarctica.AAC.1
MPWLSWLLKDGLTTAASTAQTPSGSTGCCRGCRPAALPSCRPAVGLRQGCPCCAKVAHTAPSPLQVGFFVHLYPHNS